MTKNLHRKANSILRIAFRDRLPPVQFKALLMLKNASFSRDLAKAASFGPQLLLSQSSIIKASIARSSIDLYAKIIVLVKHTGGQPRFVSPFQASFP